MKVSKDAPTTHGKIAYKVWAEHLHHPSHSHRQHLFNEPDPEKEKEMEGDMKHMVLTHYQGLMEAFRNFDSDQSGFVTVYDFRRTVYLHLGVTMAHADHLFKSIGYAENGFIDYNSWMAKCVQDETTQE